MSAGEALRLAWENGIRVSVTGSDLLLDADQEPAPAVLETLRCYKAEIVDLLAADIDFWTAEDWLPEDWRAFFDERAGIAEFDGGQSREYAEAMALESCIVQWLNQNPEHSDPGRCAWCEKPDRDGRSIVPIGTEPQDQTWLHRECSNDWHQDRRQRAQEVLVVMGLGAPNQSTGANFPDDFGNQENPE